MGRGDTVGLLRAWLGGGCWVSLPRGPLPALGFMTGGSWFSFGSFGLWGWRLPRHCPHSRGGGGSWWRAAGRRGWAVGWGRGGQRPAGARVWLGQAGQDGGRWEPRVRREQAGGCGHAGAPCYPTRNWAARGIRALGLGVGQMCLLALLLSLLPVGGARGPQFPCLHQGVGGSIVYAVRFL